MLRTVSTASRAGAASVKVPSSLIVVDTVVPCTETCPEVTASPVSESTTFPVTIRVWADAGGGLAKHKATATRITRLRIGTRLQRREVSGSRLRIVVVGNDVANMQREPVSSKRKK